MACFGRRSPPTLGSAPVLAQSRLDHDVQKTWDNIFNPGPPATRAPIGSGCTMTSAIPGAASTRGVDQCRPYYR